MQCYRKSIIRSKLKLFIKVFTILEDQSLTLSIFRKKNYKKKNKKLQSRVFRFRMSRIQLVGTVGVGTGYTNTTLHY